MDALLESPALTYARAKEIEEHLAKLEGRVTLEFNIAASGAVVRARIRSSALGAPAVHACILKRLRKWRFPRPEGGSPIPITYPIYFQAQ